MKLFTVGPTIINNAEVQCPPHLTLLIKFVIIVKDKGYQNKKVIKYLQSYDAVRHLLLLEINGLMNTGKNYVYNKKKPTYFRFRKRTIFIKFFNNLLLKLFEGIAPYLYCLNLHYNDRLKRSKVFALFYFLVLYSPLNHMVEIIVTQIFYKLLLIKLYNYESIIAICQPLIICERQNLWPNTIITENKHN